MFRAMGLRREEVYLSYLLKCHAGSRRATPQEITACLPSLRRQLEIVRPEVILLFDEGCARVLLNTQETLPRMRGRWWKVGEIDTMVTFQPRDIHNAPNLKRNVWLDLQKIMQRLRLP